MLELSSSGSVRGVSSDGHPYRDPPPQADPWYSYQRQILSKILGSGVTTSVGSGQADKMRLSRRLPRERGEEAKASLPR